MNISELSIRRPVFAWMLMAGLITFGLIAFSRLGVSQLPDVNFPVVSVSLSLPGAAPQVMESQVLDPLEDAVMTIDGIRSVTSTAQQASGSMAIEFDLNQDIDVALQEVQNQINRTLNLLPANLLPPRLRKTNPEDQPIMWLALTQDGTVSNMDMMAYARNYLEDQFGMVKGVGDLFMGGYVDGALRVWLDADKMRKKDITFSDVTTAIANEHVEVPAGTIENKNKEYNVRFMSEASSAKEFGDIRINNRGGLGANYRPQHLSDIADVEEGTVDVTRIARSDGQPTIGLGIIAQHGANAVAVAQAVREKIKEIAPTMPKAYHLEVKNDHTRFIQQDVNELTFMLILSAVLTSIVCFLFLGSWSSTINVLMAIPTSIIGTFMAIYFFGFTLNTFTMLGLSLAIGIVVDDAIMMLENIVRHQELGEKRRAAAIKGSKEITFAALAASLAIAAIFLPVVFMKGVIGRFFYQYGITVTTAVMLSLLEALTLTPMRCSRYLSVNHHSKFSAAIDRIFKKLSNFYEKILRVLLSHRWKTIFVTFAIFFSSLWIGKHLPGEMLPPQDQSQILLRLKGPVGSSLLFTNDKMLVAEKYLRTVPEVSGMFAMVGGWSANAVNQGMVFMTLVDKSKRKKSQQQIINEIRPELQKRLTGMEVVVQDLSLRGFASTRGFPVEFIIQGPDWNELTRLVEKQIIPGMKKSGAVVDVNTDVQPGMPEYDITPDRQKMAAHGVPVNTVTGALNTLFGGAQLRQSTEYQKNGHRYEIEVRLIASQREKAAQLDHVFVRNDRGELVKLSEVVTRTERPAMILIQRLNRSRAITVYANPAPGHSQQEAMLKTEQIAKSMLPPGYSIKMIGSSQSFRESFDSLFFAMILGIIVSYMVLASQFNSFIHPVTVLLALPFSITGAFVGLWAFHQSINIYSLIGFILLMGIVKKNSILLVDFTNQCRAEGLGVREALMKACPIRLRPILMTSVATVAGALPEALSLGPGAETTVPMAVAVIGGLTASTILTLFVVPCAYSLFTKLERPDPMAATLLQQKPVPAFR